MYFFVRRCRLIENLLQRFWFKFSSGCILKRHTRDELSIKQCGNGWDCDIFFGARPSLVDSVWLLTQANVYTSNLRKKTWWLIVGSALFFFLLQTHWETNTFCAEDRAFFTKAAESTWTSNYSPFKDLFGGIKAPKQTSVTWNNETLLSDTTTTKCKSICQ